MTDSHRPRRSVLYLPAIRESAVAKARTLDCDCVILDLEDAVSPDRKAEARAAAVASAGQDWGHRELVLRVNGIGTEWCEADVAAAKSAGFAAIVFPKVDGAAEAAKAVTLAGGVPVWAMIETPRAVIEAAAIAATPGITALVAGLADLGKDLRARPDGHRFAFLYSLSAMVVAARAARIHAFDGVFTDITDADGFEAEARQALNLGFDGKTLIHPSQVEPTNRIFTPSAEEIAHAQGLIEAHQSAEAEGKGVTTFGGKLVEVLHVHEAQRMLATAAAALRTTT
jgi:citrate lyase beta subunit